MTSKTYSYSTIELVLGKGPELLQAITEEARRNFMTRSGWIRALIVRELRGLGHDLTPRSEAPALKAEDCA